MRSRRSRKWEGVDGQRSDGIERGEMWARRTMRTWTRSEKERGMVEDCDSPRRLCNGCLGGGEREVDQVRLRMK